MIVSKGTSKASEPYKVGKKKTDYVLEILNLNKSEIISIDIISNQEFTQVRSCGCTTLKVLQLCLIHCIAWFFKIIRRWDMDDLL